MKVRVNTRYFACSAVIFMQLLWMQTRAFAPGLSGPLYQLLYYMKYFGAFFLLVLLLSKPRDYNAVSKLRKYIRSIAPIFLLYLIVEIVVILSGSIVKDYGLSYYTRMAAYFLDKICILIEVGCIYLLCRDKAIDCLAKTLLMNNIFIAVSCILHYGLVEFIRVIWVVLSGGTSTTASAFMEVHELTYCLGLCVIYYLFFQKNTHFYSKIRLVLLILFFVMGGKRIGFAGILLAGLLALLFHRKGMSKLMLSIIGITGTAICLIYIFIIYNGTFLAYMNLFSINVMGRDKIYTYFVSQSHLGIDYFGWGINAVTKVMENLTQADVSNMVNVRGLHNDLLKIYIEFGFIGSLLWYAFHLLNIPHSLFRRFGRKTTTLYLVLAAMAFVTYLTDNTENYFVFQVTLLLIPLAGDERQDNRNAPGANERLKRNCTDSSR